jgi:hypothetical protein
VIVVVEVVGNDQIRLVNTVFVVVGVTVLWVRPIVSCRRGKVGIWGCALMLGTLAVETGRLLVMNDGMVKYGEEQLPNLSYILSYLLTITLVSTILYNITQHRLKTILLYTPTHPPTSLKQLTNKINTLHY